MLWPGACYGIAWSSAETQSYLSADLDWSCDIVLIFYTILCKRPYCVCEHLLIHAWVHLSIQTPPLAVIYIHIYIYITYIHSHICNYIYTVYMTIHTSHQITLLTSQRLTKAWGQESTKVMGRWVIWVVTGILRIKDITDWPSDILVLVLRRQSHCVTDCCDPATTGWWLFCKRLVQFSRIFKKIAVTLGFDMILGQSIVSLAKAAPTAPLGLPGAGVWNSSEIAAASGAETHISDHASESWACFKVIWFIEV